MPRLKIGSGTQVSKGRRKVGSNAKSRAKPKPKPNTVPRATKIETEARTETKAKIETEAKIETIMTITNGKKEERKGKPRYYYCDHLYYSHLDFTLYRKQIEDLGWQRTKDAKKANMIISSYWKHLLKWARDPMMQGKKLLLWTHEPYHDWHQKIVEPIGNNRTVHVLNCYTPAPSNVFVDNYRYFRWGEKDQLLKLSPFERAGYRHCPREAYERGRFPLLALSTKYAPTYYQGNKATLLPRRYEIIEWGLKRKRAKVWGRNWGSSGAGESRGGNNREITKSEILAPGYFTIALENTRARHYITEKLWEAIESYCLPIYWSNSTIYEKGCMPSDSFIDARLIYEKWGRVRGAEKVYETVAAMTHVEYLKRMNRCIEAFNNIARRNLNRSLRKDAENPHLHIVDYSRNWASLKRHFV